MTTRRIDLRSDTATLPTPAMRQAMFEAELGDDQLREDPTVRALEEKFAELTGKEAALFTPSGTMSNQLAVFCQAGRGDELLCEASCHIYNYEAGAPAALSGVTCKTVVGDRGVLDVHDLADLIRPKNSHFVRTRLVCLENTHNRGGGTIYPIENLHRIAGWARKNHLSMHLDGARLMNAVVATGVPARRWAEHFDTVCMCFSKGLGAPAGSALAGPRDLIDKARWARQMFGGAMRQSGILAGACVYALDHHVHRLAEDHENAKILAAALEETGAFELRAADVPTNLIWAPVRSEVGSLHDLTERFRERGVLVGAYGENLLRMTTHLGVTRDDALYAANAIREIVGAAVRK